MRGLQIALIGYGRMGKIIHTLAENRGHKISLIIDNPNDPSWDHFDWKCIDVAIEFTTPSQVSNNVRKLLQHGIPVVSGTTGWTTQLTDIKEEIEISKQGALLWASNFSIGVNLFFKMSGEISRIMSHINSYSPSITEIHHIHKLDAPSGTAITLAEEVIKHSPKQLKSWYLKEGTTIKTDGALPIESIREGEVPGTHILSFQSERDNIEFKHEAHGRDGFAEGAIIAAEFLFGRCGYYTMTDLMEALLKEEKQVSQKN